MNTVTNWEASAIAANPLFTDPDNNDFRLTASSPMKSAGTPISAVTTDYYGNPFDPATPSMGAVQYGITSAPSYLFIHKEGGII